MAKEKGPTKDSILNEITMEELYKVTNEAWNASLGAQAKMGLNKQTNQYYRPNFKDMHLRKKQAAISENLCGILATFTYRARFSEWALNNPGDAMRLFVALAPKTIEVDVEQRIGVLLVPKTSENLQEWMKETNVLPPDSQAHLLPKDVFKQIAELKGVEDAEVIDEG